MWFAWIDAQAYSGRCKWTSSAMWKTFVHVITKGTTHVTHAYMWHTHWPSHMHETMFEFRQSACTCYWCPSINMTSCANWLNSSSSKITRLHSLSDATQAQGTQWSDVSNLESKQPVTIRWRLNRFCLELDLHRWCPILSNCTILVFVWTEERRLSLVRGWFPIASRSLPVAGPADSPQAWGSQ